LLTNERVLIVSNNCGSSKKIAAWKVDHQRYRAVPFYADGKPGPPIELRDLFQQFHNETSESK